MTTQLQSIHSALKQMVLTYAEAQQIDIERSYNKGVNAAETYLRVIANKKLPYVVHELMQEIQLLDAIEFEVSEISVQYLIQVVASMVNFPQIWEHNMARLGHRDKVTTLISRIEQLCEETHDHYMVLAGFMV